MKWKTLLTTNELIINTMKNFKLDGKNLLAINVENDFFVVQHLCTHDDIELVLGCIKQKTSKMFTAWSGV